MTSELGNISSIDIQVDDRVRREVSIMVKRTQRLPTSMAKLKLAGLVVAGAISWSATSAEAALIASYQFDEVSGTIANPSVGAIAGTLQGAASFVDGGVSGSRAVSLPNPGGGPASSFVNFGSNFYFTGQPFSVEIWVKTTSDGMALAVHRAAVVAGYFLYIGSGAGCGGGPGQAMFYVAYPCSGYSTTVVNDGDWHQLVGTFDGNASRIYVDGALQATSSGGNSNIAPPAGTSFIAGGLNDSGGNPFQGFVGLLDNLNIYDTALSDEAVQFAYTTVVNAPEPASLALLSLGLGLSAALRRRSFDIGSRVDHASEERGAASGA